MIFNYTMALLAFLLISAIIWLEFSKRNGDTLLVEDRPTSKIVKISIYSASDTAGGYCVPPDATLRTFSPTPCEMMDEELAKTASSIVVTSKAVNGLQLRELLTGGPIQMAAQGIGVDGMSVLPFRKLLQNDDANIVVLGCGMVDCFFTPVTLDDYLTMARQAIEHIRDAGKTPMLRGYNRFAQTDLMTSAILARRDEFDAALKAFALASGVAFIDVGSVPFYGLADLCEDELHPNLAYHKRIAIFIARQLQA
jgi:hypothetical protein